MLSKLQQDIINKKDNKIVVLSAAASGKSRIITEKTRQLLKDNINPKNIAVITFTNMAAEELRQRLADDYKDGIFIGTIHSLANQFLLSYGIDTSQYINDEKFDRLFNLVKMNPECIKKIDYILLDEAQDSNEKQFEFILNMINPSHFFICGDIRQSIYGFAGARPDLLEELCNKSDVSVYSLNENYRNNINILNFAKRLIEPSGLYDDSIPMRKELGRKIEVPLHYPSLARDIKKIDTYKDWVILTRSNAQLETTYSAMKKEGIPCDTFKQGDLSKDELSKKMAENTLKILTIHSSKGLEWNNVVVIGMPLRFNYAYGEELNIAYVAATRAKNLLVWTTTQNRKNKINNWE